VSQIDQMQLYTSKILDFKAKAFFYDFYMTPVTTNMTLLSDTIKMSKGGRLHELD
jgi:hypothetical protein